MAFKHDMHDNKRLVNLCITNQPTTSYSYLSRPLADPLIHMQIGSGSDFEIDFVIKNPDGSLLHQGTYMYYRISPFFPQTTHL